MAKDSAASLFKAARERAKSEKFGTGLPDGPYVCRTVSAKIVKSQQDNSDQIELVHMVVKGDHAGECQYEWLGTRASAQSSLTDEDRLARTLQRLDQYANAGLSIDVADVDDMDDVKAICEAITEAQPRVAFNLETRQGQAQGNQPARSFTNLRGFKVAPEEAQDDENDDLSADECAAAMRKRDARGGKAKPKGGKGSSQEKPAAKDKPKGGKDKDDDDDDDDEADVEIGTVVEFKIDGKKATGRVKEVNADDGMLSVKVLDGPKKGKVRDVKMSGCVIVAE